MLWFIFCCILFVYSALAHAFSFIHCQILLCKTTCTSCSYVYPTSILIYLIKSNQPKDGRKAEWIIPCCLAGVSSTVVSLPPHPNVATGVWLFQQTLNGKVWWKWNESMCTQLPFWFLFTFVFRISVLFCNSLTAIYCGLIQGQKKENLMLIKRIWSVP